MSYSTVDVFILKIVDNISEKDSRWSLPAFDLKCKCTFSAF